MCRSAPIRLSPFVSRSGTAAVFLVALACAEPSPTGIDEGGAALSHAATEDPSLIDPVLLDDFADGDVRAVGGVGTWRVEQGAAGGDGAISLGLPGGGFDGKDHFLRAQYKVGTGRYRYAHVYLHLGRNPQLASGELRFWVRGGGSETVFVYIASPHSNDANLWGAWRAPVPVTQSWTAVTLPLATPTFRWHGPGAPNHSLAEALATTTGFKWESQTAGESGTLDLDQVEVTGFGTETGGRWTMVWSDEFNGPDINAKKWTFEVDGAGGHGNGELQYYTDSPKNAGIHDGALAITARRERFQERDYTSARLNTRFKADWTYGRFEARAKLPIGKGMWPAIWMLPSDWVYGDWPQSGEIDIMEVIGQEANVLHGTAHYGRPRPHNLRSEGTYVLPTGDFSQDFHVFAVEWEPGQLRWYVDGHLYHTAHLGTPFDQRFHLLLNLAVGGVWPGDPDASTVFPQSMLVDYARVYRSR